MSAADDVARLLTLVPWLIERPGATVDEVADAFGVDRRTVLGDIETIGYCGRPPLGGGDLFVADVVGDRIVVEMADELREPLRLNPAEALRLVLAGEAVAAALGDEVPALRSAVEKVRRAAAVPVGVAVAIDDPGSAWLPPLREAIASQQQVRLSYRGRGDETPAARTLDPWQLHVFEGTWYLQGNDHSRGQVRTFRLDRIAELEVLDLAWSAAPTGPLPRPRYERGPDDTAVELVLAPAAGWVADAIVADEVVDLDGGRRRVRFHTDALPWVRRVLLSAGAGVEVVSPPELAQQLRAEAKRALARYESDA